MRSLLLLLALALAACGGTDADTATPGAVAAADVEPCDVLTPAMVAQALGVPETAVTTPEVPEALAGLVASMDDGKGCAYDIEGGDYDTASIHVETYEDDDAAAFVFSELYRARTDQESEQIRDAGEQARDQAIADGSVDAEDLDGVDVGGTLSGLVNSSRYEPVSGVGDQAVVEITSLVEPALPRSVNVRQGAMIYSVTAGPAYPFSQDAGNVDAIREAQVALARVVARR